MRLTAILALVTAAAALSVTASFAGGSTHAASTTWQITIENLTPSHHGMPSQPLSPPLLVVHSGGVRVWHPGTIASHVVAAVAEDANDGPAEEALPQLDGVATAVTGQGGPIPSGASHTYRVETTGGFDRISILTMLVNTNDGFTGLDALMPSPHGTTVETMAYDAGSEQNTERTSDIPGPCCNSPFVRVPEGKLIRPHAGIQGSGDLDPALYGWTGPVARITIEPLDEAGAGHGEHSGEHMTTTTAHDSAGGGGEHGGEHVTTTTAHDSHADDATAGAPADEHEVAPTHHR